jgi:hypothetical protein
VNVTEYEDRMGLDMNFREVEVEFCHRMPLRGEMETKAQKALYVCGRCGGDRRRPS